MHKFYFSLFVLFATPFSAKSQTDTFLFKRYDSAYVELKNVLANNNLFKDAVFIAENTYLQNKLDKQKFDKYIADLRGLCMLWLSVNSVKGYYYEDSNSFKRNIAIYRVLKDTVKIIDNDNNVYSHIPFSYDFNDFAGTVNWANMFVSKLLVTNSGNCHSLPYLYKILANEIGATCWLSLAPNHMYIKNRCKRDGWYNTELTSGTFPIDAWIMTSGYVTVDAVRSGIYMDTLSNQQAIALCVLDLAKEYEHQTKNYYDGFIIKCCDLSLQYFPLNAQAILLKAETLKRVYEKQVTAKLPEAKDTYDKMQALYLKLLDLGYQEMPDKMYQKWLQSIQKEKAKYNNKSFYK